MSNKRIKMSIAVLLVGVLIVGFAGCSKDEGDAEPNEAAKIGAGTTETTAVTQTTCPIMVGKPIKKDISADYQGKTVYFCCGGCVDKFKAEPEKYTKDLPQFKK